MNGRVGHLVVVGKTGDSKEVLLKHLLAIVITLLPSAALAEQFTPEQMLDVMTKSPSNRDVRVQDATLLGENTTTVGTWTETGGPTCGKWSLTGCVRESNSL